jgi:membrane protein implicated in regulation of membrane protease activity
MCHVVLLAIPFLALPVFWILPLPQAIAVYGTVLFISIFLFWKIIQALMARVITGKEALLGARGKVLEARGESSAKVEIGSEIWNAESTHPLMIGQSVVVKEINGLELIVEPTSLIPLSLGISPPRSGCHSW